MHTRPRASQYTAKPNAQLTTEVLDALLVFRRSSGCVWEAAYGCEDAATELLCILPSAMASSSPCDLALGRLFPAFAFAQITCAHSRANKAAATTITTSTASVNAMAAVSPPSFELLVLRW